MSDNLKVWQECGFEETGFGTGDREVFLCSKEKIDAYTSRILASQQAAHEAEIARLKEERDRLERIAGDLQETCDSQALQLSAANAACAMKDAQLLAAIKQLKMLTDYIDKALSAESENEKQAILEEAISYSPQQVSEWERNQLEPLRAQVAMLQKFVVHTPECKYGAGKSTTLQMLTGALPPDSGYSDNCTCGLNDAMLNTQVTAEQFIAECEQRGEVKSLEDAIAVADGVRMRLSTAYQQNVTDGTSNMTGNCDWYLLEGAVTVVQALRATSKKAG